MEHNLIRLLYLSEATERNTPEKITPILDISRAKNPTIGVCGLLCYSDLHFVQFLEGNDQSVMHLYQKITQDTRHQNCQLLHLSVIRKRVFHDWSMGALEEKYCRPIDLSDLDKFRTKFAVEKHPAHILRELLAMLEEQNSS